MGFCYLESCTVTPSKRKRTKFPQIKVSYFPVSSALWRLSFCCKGPSRASSSPARRFYQPEDDKESTGGDLEIEALRACGLRIYAALLCVVLPILGCLPCITPSASSPDLNETWPSNLRLLTILTSIEFLSSPAKLCHRRSLGIDRLESDLSLTSCVATIWALAAADWTARPLVLSSDQSRCVLKEFRSRLSPTPSMVWISQVFLVDALGGNRWWTSENAVVGRNERYRTRLLICEHQYSRFNWVLSF